jgi:hypothetical protein
LRVKNWGEVQRRGAGERDGSEAGRRKQRGRDVDVKIGKLRVGMMNRSNIDDGLAEAN